MKRKITGVTILIPSFNCKSKLFRLLDSISKSDYKKIETIVVDNGSLDGTLKRGIKKYRKVKWVDAGLINIGQTGCYNLGFAYSRKDNHVAMIDSDVIVEKDMLSKLVERLESDKKVGIVTPMVLYLEDKNWVNQAGANVDLWTGRVSIGWGPKEKYLAPKEVQNSGTVMIFKKELVKSIGCFENWFLCYFDPEYCLRAAKAGFTMWYEPTAVCYHDQPKDPKLWRPRVLSRAWLLGKNRTLFMRKHGNVYTYILCLPLIFGYYLKEALTFNIFPKWVELVMGTIAGFLFPLNRDLLIPIPTLNKK